MGGGEGGVGGLGNGGGGGLRGIVLMGNQEVYHVAVKSVEP